MERYETAAQIASGLLKIAKKMPAAEFKAMFMGGVVTSVLGQLDDAYYKEFQKCDPCDDRDCKCEVIQIKVQPALDAMRADYKEVMGRRGTKSFPA